MSTDYVACDGCGQPASPEHIARRLQRLELATRWRPIHIATLLLSGISPQADADFLYAGKFEGEAGRILEAAGITAAGKAPEAVLAEFQRNGFFLMHVLECPLEKETADASAESGLLVQRAGNAAVRIRRSLKPRRVAMISLSLAPLAARLTESELACAVLLDHGQPFDLSGSAEATERLRAALTSASTAGGGR